MRVLTFPHSFHYKIEHIDFVLDIFCLCFNPILYDLYPALCPRRLMSWYLCLLAAGWAWPYGEMGREQKEGGEWSGGLHFLGSLPACCCKLAPSPTESHSPSGLWHLFGVLTPSCRVGDEPTVSSCYCCSIPPCFSCPHPSNNLSSICCQNPDKI